MTPDTALVIGALVADAATLGLHWLYDPVRIAGVETRKGLVFLQPDAADYAGTKGYFVHGSKVAGDSAGYGEVCWLMLVHLARHHGFKRIEYQTEYRNHFGPGGKYTGYIDTLTRLTLRVLLPLEPAAFPEQSGPDDDQMPALAALPALVAANRGSLQELLGVVESAVRITSHHHLALDAARCCAAALYAVLQGDPIERALAAALLLAGDTLRPLLEEALAIPVADSVAVAARHGMACHVTEGLPVVFHIARHAIDYRAAIEANIRAGGDNCGRSIILGSLVAAHEACRQVRSDVIPLEWLARYRKLASAADACAVLAGRQVTLAAF